jgi:hypothetical protein
MVTDIRKNLRLVLGVTLLQRSVLVEIEPAWVRFLPCSEPLRATAAA